MKIHTKDTAIIRLFLEPFKWEFVEIDRKKLRNAGDLLTECFKSEDFWTGLKKSHRELLVKYPLKEAHAFKIQKDIERIE